MASFPHTISEDKAQDYNCKPDVNMHATLQGLQWEGRAHLPGVALDHINAIEELALELAALISKEQSLLLKPHCIAH